MEQGTRSKEPELASQPPSFQAVQPPEIRGQMAWSREQGARS
jgi:hypothetical protein